MLSLTLHVLVAGLLWLVNYAAQLSEEKETQIFELVAGPGYDPNATVAPAGEPGSIKVDLPAPPAPQPEAPKPVEVVQAPTPPPKPADKPAPKPPPSISKQIDRKVARNDAKLAKEREAEVKRLTKEEFDRQNQNKKAAATTANAPKIAKLDPKAYSEGLANGSKDSKTGQGGKALTAMEGTEMQKYFALLQQRLKEALEKPPGLSDTLEARVQVRINADGTLTGAHVTKSSGSPEFDQAAVAAVNATTMPPRPDKKSEILTLPFRMKEIEEGGG
jgi:colicin import membrane protein